nr:hypothetical protein [Tanacetum cinerariifolium]
MIFDGMVNVNNKVSKFLMYPRQYTRRARIAQSLALPTAADEPTSPLRDDSQGEAFPTISGLEIELRPLPCPHDSTQRVTSFAADEGSMQHKLNELMDLCTRLQRQQDEMALKISSQDLEIASLKARVKFLEDKDGGVADQSGDDAPIKGAAWTKILTSGGVQVSIPPAAEVATATVSVPTGSGVVPTASPIFNTATLEEEMARDAQRMNEQIVKDAKIARIHAEEELQMLIDGLDRSNEVIARHLLEYEQAAADLSIGEKIDLINELVKYQDHYTKILKYQAQQSKPLSKKQQREFYTSIQDFVSIGSKKEEERIKRKGIRLEQDSAKKVKTSEEVPEENLKEMMQLIPVEEVYMEALQVKHLIIDWAIHTEGEDLNQLWALVKETLSIRPSTNDKEKELWVQLKRLYEPDVEDQL